MDDPQINDALLSSLLQFDESLRSGRQADTKTISINADSLEHLDLGQLALLELEAAIPRHMSVIPSWAPQKIGRFEIISVLGTGGFAVVYLAFDPALNRQVALKIPRPHALMKPELRRRFVTEAQAAAKLDHPNIVPVFEAGEDRDLPFIACAFCEGPTLATWMSSRTSPLKPLVAAEIVRELARAVQYSHDQGILHRDIKPANVLLFPKVPGASEHFPFVARLGDFGLAKLIESGDLDTVTSQLIGTPRYMAPELIAGTGQVGDVTPDIYALGALLYCLILGHAPFGSATPAETLRKIVDSDPVSPEIVDPSIGRDLSLICMKCLQKSPQQRYVSALELGEDLDRYLSGRPVQARQTPLVLRLKKWCQRRPAVASLLGVSGCLILALILFTVRYTTSLSGLRSSLENTNSQLKRRVADLNVSIATATHNKLESDANRRLANEQIFAADQQLADELRRSGDIRGSLLVLEKYDGPEAIKRGINGRESFAWRYLRNRTSMPGTSLPDTGQIVWDMGLAPDGNRLALCGSKGIIQILDLQNNYGISVQKQIAATEFNGLAWCSVKPLVAVSGDDGIVRVCEAETLRTVHELKAIPGEHTYGIAFSPGTTLLFVSGYASEVQVWDVSTGQRLETVLTPHTRIIESLSFSNDGKMFATGGDEGFVCVWRTEDRSLIWQQRLQRDQTMGPVSVVRFTPDGKHLAVAALKDSIHLYNAATGELLKQWHGLSRIHALAAHDDAILCGDSDGLMSRFATDNNEQNWRPDIQWIGHLDKVSCISPTLTTIHRDQNRYFSADRSGRLRLWPEAFPTQDSEIHFSSTDNLLTRSNICWKNDSVLVRCGTETIESINSETRTVTPLLTHDSSVICCQYATDATSLVFADNRGNVVVLPDGQAARAPIIAFKDQQIGELSVDRQATRAVARSTIQNVAVIDLRNKTILTSFSDREASAVSPDGRWVISGNRSTDAFEIFDGRTMQPLRSLSEVDPTNANISFSADSKLFLSEGNDRTIVVWETDTWTVVSRLSTRSRELSELAMHPDGRTAVSMDDEFRLKLWDVRSGRELADLGRQTASPHGLCFSPNGETLAVCYGQLSIKLIVAAK